ncbi:uncharacterized protein METZ01_LOCUS368721, partial [marine metagenome]
MNLVAHGIVKVSTRYLVVIEGGMTYLSILFEPNFLNVYLHFLTIGIRQISPHSETVVGFIT